ncbi:MAG TPA: alginate export family protein [Flavobacterium sp.]|nr:alginate export family protein [Flavobacterium sp.]
MKRLHFLSVVLTGMITLSANAQEFDASLQLRPRYEYRHGYKNFLQKNEKPASLISQRTQLNLNLNKEEYQIYLSLKSNGVWGENDLAASHNKTTVSIFEAWVNYPLNSKISVKLGRQKLSYDNQRILGALDWAQQGLNHDAVVFQYKNQNLEIHSGYALSNTSESLEKRPYTALNYKNMQYVWLHTNATKDIAMSFLVLNTGYEAEKPTNNFKTEYHQTLGTFLKYQSDKWTVSSAFYAQTGTLNLQKKEAYNAFADVQYQWTNQLKSSVGYEYLSGTTPGNPSTVNRSFAPLYGTNHIFNGAMDYFNNGTFQNSVGLHDLYVTGKLQADKWNLEITPHIFHADKNILNTTGEKLPSLLGTEIDLTVVYQIQKDVKITAGYSQFFATKRFEELRNSTLNTNNHWTWMMITLNPTLFSSKK